MPRPNVFLTHSPAALAHYYGARALAALQAVAEVHRTDSDVPWTPATLADAAQGCDIIVSYRTDGAGAELFERLPGLVAYCRCAIDIRNIDVAAASAQGILVTQASAGFIPAVAEWIVGAMVDLGRGLSRSTAQYHASEVATSVMGRQLRGATLGIIGYGQIGRYLARLGVALGMRVVVSDPHVRVDADEAAGVAMGAAAGAAEPSLQQRPLAELLAQSDFVACLAVAVEATENLMNAATFAQMRQGAFFINASRGNLVDEAALLQALDRGQIAGCALDVGRAPDQMPSPGLARHPRVIATPHIGGLTPEAIEHQSLETVAQVAALAAGRVPLGAVNAAAAHRLAGFFSRRG
jgi:D-3-phosphoglycerate dehydrogenase / 2-oxoglutarate reductase